jgi:hypothetical protein
MININDSTILVFPKTVTRGEKTFTEFTCSVDRTVTQKDKSEVKEYMPCRAHLPFLTKEEQSKLVPGNPYLIKVIEGFMSFDSWSIGEDRKAYIPVFVVTKASKKDIKKTEVKKAKEVKPTKAKKDKAPSTIEDDDLPF